MIFTLASKELKSLFGSPMAWVILAVLDLVLAYLFLGQIDGFLAVQPQLTQLANPPGVTEIVVIPLFGSAAVVLLMATPLLGMRLIAEERRSHTLVLLRTAPVSAAEIVIGKFLGLMVFLLAIVALPVAMSLSLLTGGTIDFGLLAANTLGLTLLVGSFAALALFVSSLTAHPVVAAMGSLGILLLLWVINFSAQDPDSLLHYLSLMKHFEAFNRGIVATADVAYFTLFTVLFLALAARRLETERLGG
jgi:ABC-2 type transport system permease protein